MSDYLKQKASPWVSAAVLAGGFATAVILVMLFRIQEKLDRLVPAPAQGSQDVWSAELDKRGY